MRLLTALLVGIASWFGLSHGRMPVPHATASATVVATSSASTPSKPIYLTFDLDMNGFMYQKTMQTGRVWYNPAVFTYLEQKRIPATFFVSGLFATTYPQLMEQLASTSQFAFENHSYDESSFVPHCYWLSTLKTKQQKIDAVAKTESIIKKYTGQTATYFRFPGDCTNTQNNALIKSLGYAINDGTDISGDPFNKNANAIIRAVLSNATSSATILMHVGGPNAPESLTVLKYIVPKLEAEGYQFERL